MLELIYIYINKDINIIKHLVIVIEICIINKYIEFTYIISIFILYLII